MNPSRKTVLTVLVISVLATLVHYTDNAIYIDEYPQPEWINREVVYLAWSLLTMIGVAGYLFYRHGHTVVAGVYLFVYSYTGLSSLGHYLHGGFEDFSTKMHVLIWMDGVVGTAVAVCALIVLRSGATQRPPLERSA